MSQQPGDDASGHDTSRPSGIANVFRGLAGARPTKSPPLSSASSSSVALPITERINATSMSSRKLTSNHMDTLELLRNGTPSERTAAASTLKYAIAEYPLNPVLDIWYAGKDLIEASKPSSMRNAGWALLTECVKHPSSTDLERKEYFQTLAAPSHPDDFHLQLAAMADLTGRGRVVSGFDYELLPLVTTWLKEAYKAVRNARKNAQQLSRGSKSTAKAKVAASGEEQNFSQLFLFLTDFVKFSFKSTDETTVANLIDTLVLICMNTSAEDDLRSSISVIDTVVTFGYVPSSKLKGCVQILSSIFCLVPNVRKDAWRTLAHLLKSHNGQATVRILLDLLHSSAQDGTKSQDASREIRGALAVLQKLLTKATEKGYPTVSYALLVDGLSVTTTATSSLRVCAAVVQLINCLFDDGKGRMHTLIADEDWSPILEVATECSKKAIARQQILRGSEGKEEGLENIVWPEMDALVSQLDNLVHTKSSEYIPRQAVIDFFINITQRIPDGPARTVLDYFQEFRCCSPSDPNWKDNVSFVLESFLNNRNRSSETRLRALQAITEAYEIVDLVGDEAEQNFIPRLAKSLLQDVAEESDILVLDAIMAMMVSVAITCDMELFDYIVSTLKRIVASSRLKSPIGEASNAISISLETGDGVPKPQPRTPSNVATRAYVNMFLELINTNSTKCVKLYDSLVSIARSTHSEIDARLTAMKLLFRLRADWANRVFVTHDLETDYLATALLRTPESLAKRQAEEAALSTRSSRAEHGGLTRATRGVSFGQGQTPERGHPVRTASGTKSTGAKYHQMWRVPDSETLFDAIPAMISQVLTSHVDETTHESAGSPTYESKDGPRQGIQLLNMPAWLDAILSILHGSDWEVYSFVLVHLPSQLSNHAIFKDALPQIREIRKVICEQIRSNGFQEPPNSSGLRRADVAICLFHSLTMILSYHQHFQKGDEDEMVMVFVHGISAWERTAKCCIHALSICCHELPLSASKSLVQMLSQMTTIITQPHVSVHILEFLASLSRLHNVYINFREEEFKIVFGICFRYLAHARDQRQSNRSSHNSEPSTPASAHPGSIESPVLAINDDLPQYVYALAYHVILFWFLALKLPDRAAYVGWIAKKLFTDPDGHGPAADEYGLTSIDFLQRVAYADVDESAEDPDFTEDRFGDIVKKRWLIGNSIVTVKQATSTGWAQIVKRQASGTSAYTIRETYRPPPVHQTLNYPEAGQATNNNILPSHLLVQLISPIPQSTDGTRPIPLPDDEATERSIRVFDKYSTVDGHKVGVIYIGEGQTTEQEILANVSGSSDYVEFLNGLGTLTPLKGATFNTQNLDRYNDEDGAYTFCWRDRVTEIVFHVTTQMPTDLDLDPQLIRKKKHIGNDFVNIIFNDSGLPFNFDTFPSQFNFVNIVITPASRASFIVTREANSSQSQDQTFYRVQVLSKDGFPDISPASETKMVSLTALPVFIRLLALNASVFCLVWQKRAGGEHVSSWRSRLREIKRLREKHDPRSGQTISNSNSNNNGTGLSPPPSSLGGAVAAQQVNSDGSRPSSSVRDSFSSLRRTSMVTFFTNTSEQTSHRSSMLSTSATTNDTETGTTINGLESLVDSVNFSKWA